MALTTDNAHDFWRERYETRHMPWDRGRTNPALYAWLDAGVIAPPARVLVPGCGRGHEVLTLARRGFDVTGVDLSGLALAELDAELAGQSLSANLVESDLLSWTPPGTFDAVYEQTCLCALLPRYWPDYEAQLYDWLQAGRNADGVVHAKRQVRRSALSLCIAGHAGAVRCDALALAG